MKHGASATTCHTPIQVQHTYILQNLGGQMNGSPDGQATYVLIRASRVDIYGVPGPGFVAGRYLRVREGFAR